MSGTRVVVAAGIALATLGACARGAGQATSGVARLDAHRTLGEPVVAANLTVWPVYTDAPLDLGEFLTLEEAQAAGKARVHEVGAEAAPATSAAPAAPGMDAAPVPQREAAPPQSGQTSAQVEGAQVNTLVVENDGDVPILVCAGTVVTGGQQDRQIGQDFVIAARTKVAVDAFCVEPGRWTAEASGDGAAVFEFASLGQVAVKSVRAGGQYQKDQGKVWEETEQVLKKAAVADTTSFAAVEKKASAEAAKQRDDLAMRVADRFATLAARDPAPVGFAYAVNGKPVTVRAFAHPRVFRKQFDAFLKAMCTEADLARSDAEGAKRVARAEDVVALVAGLESQAEKVSSTAASNSNGYRESASGFAASCYAPAPGRPRVTLTQDWTAK